MKKLLITLMMMFVASFAFAQAPVKVLMETTMGNIELELYPDKAPATVENFVKYANDGYYNGLIFHRVINKFMVQGGGMDKDMKPKATYAPVKIESANGLKNNRGTIAMARTSDPNSATSQFFINHQDNPFLNYKAPTTQGYGYAVFGKVTKGMDVVDKMAAVKTGSRLGHGDVPIAPITINSVKIIK